MEQDLPVVAHGGQQRLHILKVPLRFHSLGDVMIARHEPVFPGCIVHNLPLLHGGYSTVVQMQGNPRPVCQLGQDGLLLCGGRIFPDYPDTAVGVSHNAVVGKELDISRQDAVKEIFYSGLLRHFLSGFLFFA